MYKISCNMQTLSIYAYIFMYIHVYLCIYMYMCIYVCIYNYIHGPKFSKTSKQTFKHKIVYKKYLLIQFRYTIYDK